MVSAEGVIQSTDVINDMAKTYKLPPCSKWNKKLDTPCPLLLPCTVCGDLLPPFSFSRLTKENGRKDILGNSRLGRCKKCAVKQAMARPLAQRLWYAARKRAKLKDLPFDIDVSDIEVPETCPILGIRLKQASDRGAVAIPERNASASLDRIDNRKGYVKGNVAVISMRANHVKADGTTAEIAAVAYFMRKHDERIAEKEKKKTRGFIDWCERFESQ